MDAKRKTWSTIYVQMMEMTVIEDHGVEDVLKKSRFGHVLTDLNINAHPEARALFVTRPSNLVYDSYECSYGYRNGFPVG